MENNTVNWRDFYVKYGLLLGMLSTIYLFVSYFIGISFMSGIYYYSFLTLLSAATLLFIGLEARKFNGGYIKYGEVLKANIIVLALGILLFTLFNTILITVIDPELPEKIIDGTRDGFIEYMSKKNVSDEDLDKIYQEFENKKQAELDKPLYWSIISNYLFYMFMGSVFCLFSSLIVKKEPDTPFEG